MPNEWKRSSAVSSVLSRRQLHLPLFLSQCSPILGWYNNKAFKLISFVEGDFTHIVEMLHLSTQTILHNHIHAVYDNIYSVV